MSEGITHPKPICKKVSCPKNGLELPNKSLYIYPGNIITLGRFETEKWRVCFGWFSYDGNRKICGWYLQNLMNPCKFKPIQETDLFDVFVVEFS